MGTSVHSRETKMTTYIIRMSATDTTLNVTNVTDLTPTAFTPISTVTVIVTGLATMNYSQFSSFLSMGVAAVLLNPAPLEPLITDLNSLLGSTITVDTARSFFFGGAQTGSPSPTVSLMVNGATVTTQVQGISTVTGAAGASSGLVVSKLLTSAMWTNLFNSLMAGNGTMTKLVTLAATDTLRVELVGDFYYTPSGGTANKKTFGIVMVLKQ